MSRCSLAFVLAVWATAASAQTPTLSVSSGVATPGSSVTATITGGAGLNYALLGSTVGAGLSYGGVNLAVGPDFGVLAVGVLDGSGRATVAVTPPFLGTTHDRYYLQAATSVSPAFVPPVVSASVVLRNADAVVLPPAAVVNPNGSVQFASAGISVTRTGFGAYRVTYPAGIAPSPYLTTISVIGTQRLTSSFSGATVTNLTFDGDALFLFTIVAVRP